MPTLNWLGKDAVLNHHLDVPYRTLELKESFNCESGKSENKIIHGDNLEALKALLPEYEGRVKCIYIDPPYNTGNENWVYNDNVNSPKIKKWLGQVVGKESEDLTRHDKWLCMMYPRLKLLQKLLSEDGAIFISIDDNEQANLKLICDEIFGAGNFVANVSWQRTYSIRNDSKGIPSEVEHIIVYSKNPGWQPATLSRTAEMDEVYKNPDNDEKGMWMSGSPVAPAAATHQGMVYAIQHPFTGEMLYPSDSACWRYQQDVMFKYMNGWCEYKLEDLHDEEKRAIVCGVSVDEVRKNVKAIVLAKSLNESIKKAQSVYERGNWPRFYFTNGGKGGIRRKVYLEDAGGRICTNFYSFKECGHTDEAKKEVKEIFGGRALFDTPKPTRLIERILQISSDKSSIILDSFAGSGTMAHVVLNLNKQDEGNRKFILVEMEDYAGTITAERVRRVIKGYKADKKIELYSKEMTLNDLKNASDFLEEIKCIREERREDFSSFKTEFENNTLKLYGVAKGDEEGTGGDFNFYELGPEMILDGNLNERQSVEKIRSYIYYTETGTPIDKEKVKESKHEFFLGDFENTAYYLFYKKKEITTLDFDFLSTIQIPSERYVIYADNCVLPKDFLFEHNITFKKIPRDVRKF